MPVSELNESHAQFRGAWRSFAQRCPSGEIIDAPEVFIASANVTWPIMNAAFLPAPAETEESLKRAVTSASAYFASKGRGWMFMLSEDWLTPGLREKAPQLLASAGLKPSMDATGMVTERLARPVRPLAPLEFRRVTREEGAREIADINGESYDTPLEIAREAIDVPGMFDGDCQGYVGYAGSKAVTCTAVLKVDGVAYVALVATRAAHRQQGYAEAAIRHALAQARTAWGVERTVLHASRAGYPVYLQMGYRPVTRFDFYVAGAQGR